MKGILNNIEITCDGLPSLNNNTKFENIVWNDFQFRTEGEIKGEEFTLITERGDKWLLIGKLSDNRIKLDKAIMLC